VASIKKFAAACNALLTAASRYASKRPGSVARFHTVCDICIPAVDLLQAVLADTNYETDEPAAQHAVLRRSLCMDCEAPWTLWLQTLLDLSRLLSQAVVSAAVIPALKSATLAISSFLDRRWPGVLERMYSSSALVRQLCAAVLKLYHLGALVDHTAAWCLGNVLHLVSALALRTCMPPEGSAPAWWREDRAICFKVISSPEAQVGCQLLPACIAVAVQQVQHACCPS
jgi:hypothetical protein